MGKDNDNVKEVAFNDLQAALVTMIQNKKTYLEYVKVTAEITKVKYDALVEQGFSKEQALELSKSIV